VPEGGTTAGIQNCQFTTAALPHSLCKAADRTSVRTALMIERDLRAIGRLDMIGKTLSRAALLNDRSFTADDWAA
jgi:hypothetical protein